MRLFSNFTLKIMAIIFMAMDHILTYIGTTTDINIPIWFGYFGKLAAPIFFYLIVEGFYNTRSRKKYIIRLFAIGAVMIAVDMVLGITNNVFLSLGFGVLLMYGAEYAKSNKDNIKKKSLGIIISILSGMVMLGTEASIFGLGMILIFYFLRNKKVAMPIVYIIFSLVWLVGMIGPNFIDSAFMADYQWMMVFAIIPILMYNGKRGISNKFVKWMFYWFYPIHLIIIVSIGSVIGQAEPPKQITVNEQLMEQVVNKIDSKLEYINDTKAKCTLEGDFKGVYMVELYRAETKELITSSVIQRSKNTDIIDVNLKIDSKFTSVRELNKGQKYVLVVRNIENNELLFENEVTLE
ncbi:TraX family protein [Clostridioides difficile]